jgi:hypothetical protein
MQMKQLLCFKGHAKKAYLGVGESLRALPTYTTDKSGQLHTQSLHPRRKVPPIPNEKEAG